MMLNVIFTSSKVSGYVDHRYVCFIMRFLNYMKKFPY